MEGRIQRIRTAIDAAWVREDWRVMQAIANRLGAGWDYADIAEITAELVRALPPYAAVNRAERVIWSENR